MHKTTRLTLLSVALAASMLCFASAASAANDKPLAQQIDLSGAHFTVGSKEFPEQIILGKMTIDLLKAAGADVSDQTGLNGSTAVRNALTSGKIDMYWGYTGTAWVTFLGNTSTKVKGDLYQDMAKEDLKKNGIKWLKPSNFNDTYVVLANPKVAKKYNLKKISDIGRLIKKDPDKATFCAGNEFFERPDGFQGLEKTYGWEIPTSNQIVIQESLVYKQVAEGDNCNLGDGDSSTDGRIPYLHLVTLKDDKHFFPPYVAALTMRNETYKKYPQLEKLFGPVSKALTQKAILGLNYEVEVKSKFPGPVAHQFLVKHNFIAK
jgi:osmoprotectant transport system substrate-binding protein